MAHLTQTDRDIIAVASENLAHRAANEGKDFVIEASAVELWLGAIVRMGQIIDDLRGSS